VRRAVIGGAAPRKKATEVLLSNANPYTYAHDGDDIILSVKWSHSTPSATTTSARGCDVRLGGAVIAKYRCCGYPSSGGGVSFNKWGSGSGKAIVPLIGKVAGNYTIDAVPVGVPNNNPSIEVYKYVWS